MPQFSRIIIKVGTNTLTGMENKLDEDYLPRLVAQICAVANDREVALVTSGSVRVGLTAMGLSASHSLRESQAAAAVGQGLLMHHYQQLFQQHGRMVAQVLLTHDGMHNRNRYLNARNTLLTLFEKRVIPIINENDTVATDEIKFGDNDNLAAQVAAMIGADLLIFLSNVEGFYTDLTTREVIPVVEQITPELEAAARGPVSGNSKGGMITKIMGAKVATHCGCHVFIANGRRENVIADILSGANVGTHFLPLQTRKDSRKVWIGVSGKVAGQLTIDEGAVAALRQHRTSLLPAGITAVHGDFKTGDVVRVVSTTGEEIGRGLTNYSAAEIYRIKGVHSRLLEQILGYRGDPEVIHRDNFLIYHSPNPDELEPKSFPQRID
jgi:glutamate 5-kinase